MLRKLKSLTREILFKVPAFYDAWSILRRYQHESDYRRRRDVYLKKVEASGLKYKESEVVDEVRERILSRGYRIMPRKVGSIHTFAFCPESNLVSSFFRSLTDLGPVTQFDYNSKGFKVSEFSSAVRNGAARRKQMNDLALETLRQSHKENPVDWVFVYASGREILADTIKQINEELGIPTVNLCMDDKNSWVGMPIGDQRSGQIDIASAFDVTFTTARVSLEWYGVEGGRAIYLPEGFDEAIFCPTQTEKDIPVSFVGSAYGFRPRLIRDLKRYNIPVEVYGPGWGTRYLSVPERVEFFNRSRINLGFGDFGYSDSLTNVKGRDFEVPGTGGGVYLTSFNSDLAQHFVIGKEILCYRGVDELVELIRYYLSRPNEAEEIAFNGRKRALSEHTWFHRYLEMLHVIGVVEERQVLFCADRNEKTVAA